MLDCKLLVCQWQLESVSSSGTLDSIDIVGPTSSWFWLVREKEVTLMSAVMLNYIQNCPIFKLTIQNTVYFSVFSPKTATEDLYPLILCKKTFQFNFVYKALSQLKALYIVTKRQYNNTEEKSMPCGHRTSFYMSKLPHTCNAALNASWH